MKFALRQSWTVIGTYLNLVTCGFHLGYPTILLRDRRAPGSEIQLSMDEESWSWIICGTFLNLISCGFHLGYSTILLRDLRSPDSEIQLSFEAESWVVSAIAVSAFPSALIIAPTLQILGRKAAHITIILPNLIACLVLYLAQNTMALLIARFLSGFTIGTTIFSAAVMIGEYSSPKYRGVFLNTKSAGATLGIFLVHLVGLFFDWRMTALIGITPSVLSFLNTLTWKESPAWLAYKGNYEACKASFEWLRGNDAKSKKELLLLIQAQRDRRLSKIKDRSQWNSFKQNLFKFTQKDFQKPSLIVMFAYIILESSGRHSFSAYAVKFMSAFTIDNTTTLHYVLIVDAIVFISTVCSCAIVKFFSRRFILLASGALACGLLTVICLYLYLKSLSLISNSSDVWLPVFLIILYFIIINAGVASVVICLLGEIYPLEHRGVGSVVSGLFFSLSLLLALKVTPYLIRSIEVYGTFFIYSLCMAGSLVYLYIFLPETEGKTLQEIEHHFNGVPLTLQNDYEEQLLERYIL